MALCTQQHETKLSTNEYNFIGRTN